MSQLSSPIGLIAGNGSFPIQFIKAANSKNIDVVVVAHQNESDPALEQLTNNILWVKVGQLQKIINHFKKSKIKDLAIIGGIKRARLFRELWPDWRALKVLAQLPTLKDDCVLKALAGTLEQEGFKVFSAAEILTNSIAQPEMTTIRSLTEQEEKDASIAWQAAKAIGTLDIGQAAIAYQGTVIALEAVEGTDQMIARVANMLPKNSFNNSGAVLVKVAKPIQDLRLDLPAVGKDTLEHMYKAGVTAIVLEANKAIISQPTEFLNLANKLHIAVAVWTTDNHD